MVGAPAMLMLQRKAGNAAVSALMAAKFRGPGETAVAQIDGALRELRRDEPAVETVETGLNAAKATGIPVDLEGTKPPASALAVTTTGFGPGQVPAKKPVPPPGPVPKVSPLGLAGAKAKPPVGKAGTPKVPGPALAPTAAAPAPAAALSADQLLQPPAPPTPVRPEQDSAFTRVTGGVKSVANAKRAHPPAASKAKEAQDAAVPPTGDVAGQAKAVKVDSMAAQQPGTFDKLGFIAAVKTAIEAKSPKTLKEADDYKASGKAGEVKGEVAGLVSAGTEGQARDIETATEAPPDQSKAVPKQVTAMGPEAPGEQIVVPADGSVPKRAPPEQLNLAAGKQQADQELVDAEVSEDQLATSNEPQFEQALTDKKTAASHADSAPADFRKTETAVLEQGKAEAQATTADGAAGMQSAKGAALAKLVADKGKAKTKDEAKRAEVTTKVEQIFAATEAAVKKILDGVDPLVESEFSTGEAKARAAFESFVATKMSAYKKDRYGGWLGGLRWAKDKLVGMPAKVNEFYTAGRELYLKQMDAVISRVADIVGGNLTAAKQRIAGGRLQIAEYVKSLPTGLQKVGAEASKEIGERFEQLESDVDDKQNSVVDTLATKYVEARKGLDERIEALQAENKGLVDKAIGAIKAVINTIRELVAMLKNVLARVAGVVADIVKNPIGFLGNLIAGIKGGIAKFADNILDHLRTGLMSWLFGALAEAGIELPDSFDLKGIIKLLASIFGLTWTNIRTRLVKQIGEKAMGAVEKGVEIFSVLRDQGVGGLWQMLLEKLGDIKEMILEQVKDFVVTKIITAGITWLIGLLNPAAAFIKACKLIYDVVMFFVDNAARIKAFVDTIIDATGEVVKGNIGGVINKINDVLGKMVPILIGFLASVIGLGGIGEKIRSIIQKLQKPVNAALDFVIMKGLQLAAPIIRGLKGVSKKVKAKVAAGKAYVKGKVEAGKAWAANKAASVRDRLTGRREKDPAKAADAVHNKRVFEDVVRSLRTSEAGQPAPADFVTATDQRAAKLQQDRQPQVKGGGSLSVRRTEAKPTNLRYEVVVQKMAAVVAIPVTYRDFLGVDGEKAVCAASHIEERHIRMSPGGKQGTTSDLALRLLQNTFVGGGPGQTVSGSPPRNAGYFASKAQANTYIAQAFGTVQANWASISAQMAASNYLSYLVPGQQFRFAAAQGLQLNPFLLGTVLPAGGQNARANALRAQYAANPDSRPLYPGDPEFAGTGVRPWCLWSGGEDWSGPGAGEVEAPILIAFKAKLGTPAAPVPGNWYVDSAYPNF